MVEKGLQTQHLREQKQAQPMKANLQTSSSSANRSIIESSKFDASAELKRLGIVPDVLSSTFTAQGSLIIDFGKSDVFENLSAPLLYPHHVKKAPKVFFNFWDGRKLSGSEKFALVMLDPDAPSRSSPANRSFLHYLIGNVGMNWNENENLWQLNMDKKSGDELVEFMGGRPPQNTGKHRYVFFLFCFNDKKQWILEHNSKNRSKFNLEKFMRENRLDFPIGTAMFESEHL